jgi:trans-aconitate methyltransferase
MKISPQLTQKKVIRSWHARADAYNELIERWPIFTHMVNRLLEFIPKEFEGHALDIGGGSGLLAKQLLERNPNAQVTLIEPAEAMRNLATKRLGSRVEILDSISDELNQHSIVSDAAFCSASFHLMNEETTLPSVASVLRKGSVFAVNCWGHSFDEAIALNQKIDWMQYVDQALSEFDQTSMHRTKEIAPKIKTAEGLRKIGVACELDLLEPKIVTAEIETQFNIEFAAMDPNFLNHVNKDIRKKVINRALKLCQGTDTISYVDLCFKKVS